MQIHIPAYIAFLSKSKKCSKRTIELYKRRLDEFQEYFEGKIASELKTKDLDKFLDKVKKTNISSQTFNQYVSTIKGFFKYLAKIEKFENIAQDVKTERIEKVEKVSDNSISIFLDNLEKLEDPRKTIFLIYICLGLNTEQISKLKKDDIIIEDERIGIKLSSEKEKDNKYNYYITANNKYGDRLSREIIEAKAKSKKFLFETSSSKPLTRPHFIYIFNQFKKYIPEKCSSILKVKSDKFLLKEEIELDKSLGGVIGKRYKLERLLGTGASCNVYLAYDLEKETHLALKLLNPQKFNPDSVKLFKEEFSIVSKLNHPLIAPVYDFAYIRDIDRFYFTMQYIDFDPLSTLIRKITIRDAAIIIYNILDLLAYIKLKNLVHYDIKPSNIMFKSHSDNEIEIKLIDFGFASTKKDNIARGTFLFSAPEILLDKNACATSDLYSLGISIYHVLTGKFPFSFDSFDNYMDDIENDKAIPISNFVKNIPDQFEAIISKMIEYDPRKRYQSEKEAINELDEFIKGELLTSAELSQKLSISIPSFIGRENEIEKLKRGFNLTFSKDLKDTRALNITTISGESGIGKQRLTEELLNHAHLAEAETMQLTLTEDNALNDIIEFCSPKRKISEDINLISEGPTAIKSSVLKRLSERFYKYITNHSRLLIINNAEYLTKDQIIFFRFFLDELKYLKNRLMIIITLNSDKGRADTVGSTIKSRVPYFARADEIHLSRFSKENTEQIISSSLSKKISDELLEQVYISSGGNPGYIIIILSNLLEKSALTVKNKTINLKRVEFEEIPTNIVDIVSERIKSLDPVQRTIVFIVSEFESAITINSLFSMIQRMDRPMSHGDLLLKVENLIARNFLTMKKLQLASQSSSSIAGEVNILSLADNLLKDSVKIIIGKKEAKQIHKAIAQELEEYHQFEDKYKESIAHHFLQASENAKATIYSQEAAIYYQDNGLLEKAVDMYQMTLLSLGAIDTREKENIKENCFLELGKLMLKLGEFAKSEEYLSRIEAMIIDPHKKARILSSLGLLKTRKGQIAEGIEIYDEAIKLAKDDKIEDVFVEVTLLKVTALLSLSNYKEANDLIENLKKSANISEKDKITLFNLSGLLNYYKGDFTKAQADFRLSLEFSEDLGNIASIMRIQNNIGMIHFQMSNLAEAIAWYDKAIELSIKSSDIFGRAIILQNKGNCFLQIGNLAKSLEIYMESYNIFLNLDKPMEMESGIFNIGLIYRDMGDLKNAAKYAQDSLNLSILRNNTQLTGYNYGLFGDINYYKGEYDNALTYYQKASEIFKSLNLNTAYAETLLNIVHIKKISGKTDQIESYLNQARQICEHDYKLNVFADLLAAKIALSNDDLKTCKKLIDRIDLSGIDGLTYQTRILLHELYGKFYLATGKIKEAKKQSESLEIIINSILENIPETLKPNFLHLPLIKPATEFINEIKYSKEGITDHSKLKKILEINMNLSSEFNLKNLLDMIIDNAIIFSGAKRGFILMKALDGDILKVEVARNFKQKDIADYVQEISSTIFNQTINYDKIINIENATEDFFESKSIQKLKLKSVISFPLIDSGKVIGSVYLDDPTQVGAFNDIDIDLLSNLARQASLAISNSKLVSSLKNKNEQISVLNEKLENRLMITEEGKEIAEETIKAKTINEAAKYDYKKIISQSPKMMEIFEILDKVNKSDFPVLIIGESGTGKELIARAIHFNGMRNDNQFLTENCGALTESILESELFGYVKGAFTDAVRDKRGIFELADKGTLFLDEIGEMSVEMQKKLLRAIQYGEIRRVGGNKSIRVDVRIISATNRNLNQMVDEGKFREDLYFRINVIEIKIPPLRDRLEDIPLLVDYFLKKHDTDHSKQIDKSVLNLFTKYTWPGNIRELENEIKRLIVLTEGDVINSSLLEMDKRFSQSPHSAHGKKLSEIEKQAIETALIECNGNKAKAATLLGIARQTLNVKMKKYGIADISY
ncbi:MAG: sigma 54-interacting transcriptional regulator [Pseudomonadota bacterium]